VPCAGGDSVIVGGVFRAKWTAVGGSPGCEGGVRIQGGAPWAARGQTVGKAAGTEIRKATKAATSPMTEAAFFKVDVNANTVTIDGTSQIDVTNRGFLGGSRPGNPFGRNGMTLGFVEGSAGGSAAGTGGSYGGLGGAPVDGIANPVYGSSTDTNEPGSGGSVAGTLAGVGGNGGGLIRVVAGVLQLDGTIASNGGAGFSGGGGSGGGIRLDVGTLSGTGLVTADGRESTGSGGGGGGGRIAIYYQDATAFDLTTQVTAQGGTGNTAPDGQNGTIYVEQIIAILLPIDGEPPVKKAQVPLDTPVQLASLDLIPLGSNVLPSDSESESPLTVVPSSRLRNLKQLITKIQSATPDVPQRRLYRRVSSTNDQTDQIDETDQIDQTNNRHQNRALALLTPDASRLTDVDPIYTYDFNGNRVSMIDPTGLTTYNYDVLNRLTSITNNQGLTTTFTYDALGRRTTMTHNNGVVTTYTYDAASQLLSLVHQLGLNPPINSFAYTYDKVGNRKTRADNNGSANYTYDTLNRLVQATNPIPSNPLESFTYDPVGNRVDSNQNGTSTFNDGNQLEDDAGFTYQYDNNGNLTQKTNKITSAFTLYEYDAENKLIRVVREDGSIVNYRYDGLGRRIEKEVDSVVTQYIYDNEDILLELDGSNNILARYTHGPGIDEPLVMEKAGQSFVYHADGLGSITEISDSTGALKQLYTYSSFGKIESQTDPNFTQPYTFTGREFDSETGNHFYRARYYDPSTGRFLQQDPIGLAGGINLFIYVDNDPLNLVDPYGLFSWEVIKSSITLKGGISVGLKLKAKISKVELEASLIEVGNQASFNLAEGPGKLDVKTQINTGVAAKFGKHEVGIKFGREKVTIRKGQAVRNPVAESTSVLGYRRGPGSAGLGTIGIEGTVLIVNVGVDVDLIKLFKGIFGGGGTSVGGPCD